jgi:thymidylate synthase
MNNLDKQYQELLRTILDYGVDKSDRTGTGTKSIFGYTIRHNMAEGFPLLTTKKMAVKTMMTELKWFLKGDTNIKYLVDNGCNIWNGDAYKAFLTYVDEEWEYGTINELFEDGLIIEESNDGKNISYRKLTQEEFINKIKTDGEFAKEWGELGPIYGHQWRKWKRPSTREEKITEPGIYHKYIDQIQNLINELKTNPDSRRLMVSAWNVGELDNMVLPPCHYGFQVYTRLGQDGYRYISLMWNQRSVDTFLGLPFNIASYGMLLLLLAEELKMIPEHLIGNLGDVHLYNNHIKQATEQLKRTPFPLPDISLENVDILNGEFDYQILGYKSHSQIKAPLSN